MAISKKDKEIIDLLMTDAVTTKYFIPLVYILRVIQIKNQSNPDVQSVLSYIQANYPSSSDVLIIDMIQHHKEHYEATKNFTTLTEFAKYYKDLKK